MQQELLSEDIFVEACDHIFACEDIGSVTEIIFNNKSFFLFNGNASITRAYNLNRYGM